MVTSKEDIAKIATDISDAAADILKQLAPLIKTPTFVEEFYLGLLTREKVILTDIACILRNNSEQLIMSSFILSRVLLDDFIRLFSVISSKQKEEEIVKIMADAQKHVYSMMEQSAQINEEFYEGKQPGLFTNEKYEKKKQEFLNNNENDKYFKDKQLFKFKKLPPIADVFNIIKKDVKVKANVHCKIEYKLLTQYVHYSNQTYNMDADSETRKLEIEQLTMTYIYCYKMICMHFSFFLENYPIKWRYQELADFFATKTVKV
jgi:hypothetical protein